MRQAGAWVGFVLGAAALILQLSLTIAPRLALGESIGAATVYYVSFLTILANLGLVLVYASDLWPTLPIGWFRAPVTRAMLATAVALVGLFYHLVLAETWDPDGVGFFCDIALHYVTPALYILWWLVTARHGQLKWTDVPAMLLPPTIYLIYVTIRGALTGQYPYPIFDAQRLEFGLVAINVLVVLIGLAALATLVVGVDQLLAPRRRKTPEQP